MSKLTLENCKAPLHTEFPRLAKIGADKLFAEARQIKLEMTALRERLGKLQPRIQAKLDAALGPLPADDDDAGIVDGTVIKSVLYEDLLVTRRKGYTRHSLDKRWAVKKLIAKGVKREEIIEHTKDTEIEPGVSVRLLGEDDGDYES